MKYGYFTFALLVAGAAQADPGHLGHVPGHDHSHWLAAAALGVAIMVGAWVGLKAHKGAVQPDVKDASDKHTQEA